MKIKVICVGKIKEKFFQEAIKEYSKRLSKFCSLEILEVTDEMTPDGASQNVVDKILSKEGDRILNHIKDSDYVITLAIEGKKLTSEQLADKVNDIVLRGYSSISFIIGGSLGVDSEIKKRSNFLLSFSDMTFPHQLMRVVLLEQVYRAFKINANEPYHK